MRKIVILLLLLGLLVPASLFNIGANAEAAGWSGPLLKFSEPLPFLTALLLCQRWTLFSEMAPFNFTMHFEVELRAAAWFSSAIWRKNGRGNGNQSSFTTNQKPSSIFTPILAPSGVYLEYLVRTNGLNPAEIARRVIYIRYQNIFPRDQAAVTGTHYGPDARYALDSY